MKSKTVSSGLLPTIFAMLIVSCGAALILGYVYQITQEPISKAKNEQELQAISEVIYKDFDNDPFTERTIIMTPNNKYRLHLYPARKNGVINSVAIKSFSNKGFGGRMDVIVGFFLDGTISGFKVINHQETPGLGTKVNEKRFQEQFSGLNPGRHILKVKQDGGEIDAVTAATISSRAVIDAIQKAYDAYNKFSTGM